MRTGDLTTIKIENFSGNFLTLYVKLEEMSSSCYELSSPWNWLEGVI